VFVIISDEEKIKMWMTRYKPIADSIALLFKPYVEVVLHDIATDTIAYIANAYSDRKIGDPSDLGFTNDASADNEFPYGSDVEGPYENAGSRGQRIRSISSALTDDHGNVVGLMCINADFSVMEASLNVLEGFLRPVSLEAPPKVLFQNASRDSLKLEIREFLDEYNLSFEKVDKQNRIILIERLEAKNLFYARKSAEQFADLLGVSRATIYKDLKTIRNKNNINM